ncbi:MAG: hypothetical protein IJF07_03670, partial [Lachnospiraceae bacterium]|nr:hypothetical protein [Lachnospiraceae bacterium]
IMLIEQLAILHWKETQKAKWLWLLPILSVVEMNMQAALWPMLFVMVLPHVVPDFLNRTISIGMQLKEKKDFVLPLIATFLAGFINPRVEEGVFYLIASYNNSAIVKLIGEMKSPKTASFDGIVVILAFALLFVYLYYKWDWKSGCFTGDISKVYMLAGVGLLTIMHVRNMWLLLLGIVPVMCELFSQKDMVVWDNTFLKRRSHKKKKELKKAEVLLLAIELVAVLIIEAYVLAQIPVKGTIEPYMEAADYLDAWADKEDVILYTTFNAGGYLEWRGYQVYIDSRAEAFQKQVNGVADIADEYFGVIAGRIDYPAFLEKYQFTHILTEKNGYFDLYLKTSGAYKAVVVNEEYVLYEK